MHEAQPARPQRQRRRYLLEAEACDLTQQTFCVWANKGYQLRDKSKVKTWLFTTLHREYLQTRRRQTRFPHHEISEVEEELPRISPETVERIDSQTVLILLGQIEETYRAPLVLFYIEDLPYKEIASVLELPLGTVKSRIARGKSHLYRLLMTSSVESGKEAPNG